jgi:hypothetical protein
VNQSRFTKQSFRGHARDGIPSYVLTMNRKDQP